MTQFSWSVDAVEWDTVQMIQETGGTQPPHIPRWYCSPTARNSAHTMGQQAPWCRCVGGCEQPHGYVCGTESPTNPKVMSTQGCHCVGIGAQYSVSRKHSLGPKCESNRVTDSPCLWWTIGRVVCWRLRWGMEDVAVGPGYERALWTGVHRRNAACGSRRVVNPW